MKNLSEASRAKAREYGKETYKWRKEHGICVDCGRNDAMDGKVRCAKCRAKVRRLYLQHREEYISRAKTRIQRHLDEGLCISCGNKVDGNSRRHCLSCLEKRRVGFKGVNNE